MDPKDNHVPTQSLGDVAERIRRLEEEDRARAVKEAHERGLREGRSDAYCNVFLVTLATLWVARGVCAYIAKRAVVTVTPSPQSE